MRTLTIKLKILNKYTCLSECVVVTRLYACMNKRQIQSLKREKIIIRLRISFKDGSQIAFSSICTV